MLQVLLLVRPFRLVQVRPYLAYLVLSYIYLQNMDIFDFFKELGMQYKAFIDYEFSFKFFIK